MVKGLLKEESLMTQKKSKLNTEQMITEITQSTKEVEDFMSKRISIVGLVDLQVSLRLE